MNSTIALQFTVTNQQDQEILLARLSDAGFDAFEQDPTGLIAYINESAYHDLPDDVLGDHEFTVKKFSPQNWNAAWETSFEPVLVRDFCGIRASFHQPLESVRYEIIITPKMSFGTGHHATTWLMIDQISELDIAGRTVLDFGTGTGVLAILADKMGAGQVVAIDNDDWSIANAAENLVANHSSTIELFKSDNLEALSSFHLILANINKHVLVNQLASIKQHLDLNGVVVLSGLLKGDRNEMVELAEANALQLYREVSRDNWISLAFVHQA